MGEVKLSRKKAKRQELMQRKLASQPKTDPNDPRPRHKVELRALHEKLRKLREERDLMGSSLEQRQKKKEMTKAFMQMEVDFKARTEAEFQAYLDNLSPAKLAEHERKVKDGIESNIP
eukprot:CAMPEP_0175163186 /NCGR_PEP_ID=MMETSP0087-20121206/25598_1 /TAXON_ID=136419 /ORGANISM="Unknown Unknown, Strain D1" /LENGTH=117 /DNA_ID=CAMNT_0016451839 /DNA_START=121 /DNA_END=475 /DNA_ORIENTATION=-